MPNHASSKEDFFQITQEKSICFQLNLEEKNETIYLEKNLEIAYLTVFWGIKRTGALPGAEFKIWPTNTSSEVIWFVKIKKLSQIFLIEVVFGLNLLVFAPKWEIM